MTGDDWSGEGLLSLLIALPYRSERARWAKLTGPERRLLDRAREDYSAVTAADAERLREIAGRLELA